MPFISGPTDSSGIPIETDTGVKEFDAVSSGGTIKAGTPISMVDVFNIGDTHVISGLGTFKQMRSVGNGQIVSYSSYANKLCVFQLSGNILNLSSSVDIPASLKLQSGEYDYSTYYTLEILSDTSAIFVKSSEIGVTCATVSFSSNNIIVGTPYVLPSSNRITNDAIIKLDNTHIMVFTTVQINGTHIERHPVLNILSINGTTISKGTSIQLTQETYGGYADMVKLKDYALIAWHPDSGDSKYYACYKYINGTLSMCGSPTYNAKITDGYTYISDNTLYVFESVSYGYDGYQTTCSDSGVDSNTSYPYTLWSRVSSSESWWMPDGQNLLLSTLIGNINITKNTTINIVENNGYEAYVIFKDSKYCYSALNPTWWKSLVLFRQFTYKTTGEYRYHGTAPRFSIDDTHVFFSEVGSSSASTLNYCICTIRPTVEQCTYIADGIATTDITETSGKCVMF